MINYDSTLQQFANHVELRDLRPATKKQYHYALRQLIQYFQVDATVLTEDQVRAYFLFLRQEKKLGPSALHVARAALRAFFQDHHQLGANWTVFAELKVRRPQTLPLVLSREEVARLIGAVRIARFRVCLRLIYHCGLRITEAVKLVPTDIVGRSEFPTVRVRDGKGGKDRLVPIAPVMVQELRSWWKTHRNRRWLFPAPGPGGLDHPTEALHQANTHMSVQALRQAFRLARQQSRLPLECTVHTLRHSYATHLLEEGICLRQISHYLGHASLDTTVIYVHLTAASEARTHSALTKLHRRLS